MTKKVALITGGASGMGLKVAEALASRTYEDWDLHIVDLNAEAGEKATTSLKNAHFHQTNVTDYQSLTSAFEAAFNVTGRLDFVFANAGIVERDNFYEKHDLDAGPPPPPNQLSIDINYKAVVNTSHIALHYFRKAIAKYGKDKIAPVLVMTASCGGLYPSEFCPMYSGSKAAVVQFNRAITVAYHHEGIRTFATCPGTIRTGLLNQEEWKNFPDEYFTPVETLVDAVLKIVDGGDIEDAKGKKVKGEDNWGLTVEVNGNNFYFRDQTPFCDANMEAMMKNTSMANQLARIEKTKREQADGRTNSV
ncbi:NAD(P)-binding protein [Cucurbitaria berberidis CBS 394.84]|uniref:NAD(P)-binding protein n=1 Tax=Cucurbitaria berberidis CBS 394.84 TaxID=1168544 RepID=A0A9P4GHJ4_9PLEO|nr:NAD(P)-binding protein [Cucurbitaria berberidis CBS 394.84]KAF1846273.1 NAD(P)-binding protein [Cucurbitaria berberidis CBS 394.84]